MNTDSEFLIVGAGVADLAANAMQALDFLGLKDDVEKLLSQDFIK